MIIQKPEGYDFLPDLLRKSGVYFSEIQDYSSHYYNSCSADIESTILYLAIYKIQNNDNPDNHVPLDTEVWTDDYSKEFTHPTGDKYKITIPSGLKEILMIPIEHLNGCLGLDVYTDTISRYTMVEKLN